jgi:hypothetical protein
LWVLTPVDLDSLAPYIERFIKLIGRDRWFKRANHLDNEQRKSPFRWKIVADYHWLEMAISFQANVWQKEGRLRPELTDELILAALNFAATTVEVHDQLSARGKQVLEGRLRDALKADTGFAPVYLELDLAQRLMDSGYDVEFVDMEGTRQFDLLFRRNGFTGEVECKSLSADAGRQIHRKDFYRFMESIMPAMAVQRERNRQEVLVITLDARLSPNTIDQAKLLNATIGILVDGAISTVAGHGFKLERKSYSELLAGVPVDDQKAFYKNCGSIFGPNTHIAGGLTEGSGCLVVMRSQREDDTSKPMLEAMRKATSQFSGKYPSFIAIQDHGIQAADLMLPHVRRRAGILSYALFGHYGGTHVNATYFTGFGAVVARDGKVGTPAFGVPNPEPAFRIHAEDAAPFLMSISDADYADAIGAPLPASNISFLPIDVSADRDDGVS